MARKGREWSPRGPEGIPLPFSKGDVIIPHGKTYPDHALEVYEVLERGEFRASPVGGGSVMRFGPAQMEKYRFRRVMPEEMVLPWRRGKFWMDFLGKNYPGWTTGDLWNGWATPYFEKKAATAIFKESVKAYKEMGEAYKGPKEEFKWSYDEKKDVFTFQGPHDEEPEPVKGGEIVTTEGVKNVYGIGAYSWTWTEED